MDTHEEEYSAIDSAASRVLASLLDLELLEKVSNGAKEDKRNMCEAIRQMRASSRAEGKAEGMVEAYNEMGLSPEEISQKVGISIQEVDKYLSKLQV